MEYNTIIIGAGISGLYIGNNILDKDFLILEKRDRIGGRIASVNYNNNIYDAGAVRIPSDHKIILKLIKRLKLENDLLPMNPNIDYHLRTYFNKFKYFNIKKKITKKFINSNLYNDLYKKIKNKKINKNNYSIYELASLLYNSEYANLIKDSNGYDTETMKSNINSFIDAEGSKNRKYYILENGLSQITKKLYEKINKYIRLNSKLINIEFKNHKFILNILNKNKNIKYKCANLILTIPYHNLSEIEYINNNISMIHSVNSINYIRIYAIYPKINNKYWFEDVNNITTDGLLRKIIPYNYKKGIIEVCYCDGIRAEYWNNLLVNNNYKDEVKKELKKVFPNIDIPEPLYIMAHYWKNGTHYWKMGIDSNNIKKKIIKPLNNNLYICGETYSSYHGWIEGALDTSNKVLKCINKKKKCHVKEKKIILKKYSMEEVKKHNKLNDGWLVYNKKVYNVTKFIKKHPGALAIKKGLGKDATTIFNNVGHSKRALNIMKKYLIGIVI